jgi:hypothetical protein
MMLKILFFILICVSSINAQEETNQIKFSEKLREANYQILALEFNLSASTMADGSYDPTLFLPWLKAFVGDKLKDGRLKAIQEYNLNMTTINAQKQTLKELPSFEEAQKKQLLSKTLPYGDQIKTYDELINNKQELYLNLVQKLYQTNQNYIKSMISIVNDAYENFQIAGGNWQALRDKGEQADSLEIGNEAKTKKIPFKPYPYTQPGVESEGYVKFTGMNVSGGSHYRGEVLAAQNRGIAHHFYYVGDICRHQRGYFFENDQIAKNELLRLVPGLDSKNYFCSTPNEDYGDFFLFNFMLPGLNYSSYGRSIVCSRPALPHEECYDNSNTGEIIIADREARMLVDTYNSQHSLDQIKKDLDNAFENYIKTNYAEKVKGDLILGLDFGLNRDCFDKKALCVTYQQLKDTVHRMSFAQAFVYSRINQMRNRRWKNAAERFMNNYTKENPGEFLGVSDDTNKEPYYGGAMRHHFYSGLNESFQNLQSELGKLVSNINNIDQSFKPQPLAGYSQNTDYDRSGEKLKPTEKQNFKGIKVGDIKNSAPDILSGQNADAFNNLSNNSHSTQNGSFEGGDLNGSSNQKNAMRNMDKDSLIGEPKMKIPSAKDGIKDNSPSLQVQNGSLTNADSSSNSGYKVLNMDSTSSDLDQDVNIPDEITVIDPVTGKKSLVANPAKKKQGSSSGLKTFSIENEKPLSKEEIDLILANTKPSDLEIYEDDSIFMRLSKTYIRSYDKLFKVKGKVDEYKQDENLNSKQEELKSLLNN